MLTSDGLLRVVRANVLTQLRAQRLNDSNLPRVTDIDATFAVKDGPLALDSLEYMSMATSVAAQFNLFDVDFQDNLLRYRSLGQWCEVLSAPPVAPLSAISFATSGSTGEPKRMKHPLNWLEQEVNEWDRRLPPIKRVISLCPVHHIYGFIWGVLLPQKRNVPGLDLAIEDIVPRSFEAGDLIVATPAIWRMLSAMSFRFAPGVIGATSTEPMPDTLARSLVANGLKTLYQIYGSSETAGLAFREHAGDAFTLLDFWQRPETGEHDDQLVRHCIDEQARLFPAPDYLTWLDDRRFDVRGRRDQAVQVGGHNVSLQWVETQLKAHANVADAAVRTFEPTPGDVRLKAFLVLKADEEQARHDFTFWLQQTLPSHARPRALRFGPALPTNAMGKRSDWSMTQELQRVSA
jgi:long-chain acyl-CoA synthetase